MTKYDKKAQNEVKIENFSANLDCFSYFLKNFVSKEVLNDKRICCCRSNIVLSTPISVFAGLQGLSMSFFSQI